MNRKSEKSKMLAGKLYRAADPELVQDRIRTRGLLKQYNDSPAQDAEKRLAILEQLLGHCDRALEIEPPFWCDYGYNIFVGGAFYANFNCVILDCARVTIGRNVFLGPAVQIYTATHLLTAAERNKGLELAKPVTIGDNAWIGGGAIINPGVTIGDAVTIGSGSVVTRDIPSNVLAAGNPCRVIRELG